MMYVILHMLQIEFWLWDDKQEDPKVLSTNLAILTSPF